MARQKKFTDLLDSVSSDTVFHKNAAFTTTTKKNNSDKDGKGTMDSLGRKYCWK